MCKYLCQVVLQEEHVSANMNAHLYSKKERHTQYVKDAKHKLL
jgi:hypothetical protein